MQSNNATLQHSDLVGAATGPVERAHYVPAEAQVRALAHEIYRVRCKTGEDGDELSDWCAAESELKLRGADVPDIESWTRSGNEAALARNEDRGQP